MTLSSHRVLAAAALLALISPVLVPAGAAAFSYKTTAAGDPVRWNQAGIEVVLDESLSALCPRDIMEDLLSAAFDEWVDAADLPLEVELTWGTCGEAGVGDSSAGNCVTADAGYFSGTAGTGATTLVSYVLETGVIRDADIVVNAIDGLWRCGETEGDVDLAAAMLHEVGHFLGMSHSEIDEAVMSPTMSDEDEAAPLHEDDIEGAAALYEGLDIADELACSVSAVGSDPAGPVSFLCALFAFAAVRFVRRTRMAGPFANPSRGIVRAAPLDFTVRSRSIVRLRSPFPASAPPCDRPVQNENDPPGGIVPLGPFLAQADKHQGR
jgi:hypothetical protein